MRGTTAGNPWCACFATWLSLPCDMSRSAQGQVAAGAEQLRSPTKVHWPRSGTEESGSPGTREPGRTEPWLVMPCTVIQKCWVTDSKLRGCDLGSLKVRDICHGDQVASRAVVM